MLPRLNCYMTGESGARSAEHEDGVVRQGWDERKRTFSGENILGDVCWARIIRNSRSIVGIPVAEWNSLASTNKNTKRGLILELIGDLQSEALTHPILARHSAQISGLPRATAQCTWDNVSYCQECILSDVEFAISRHSGTRRSLGWIRLRASASSPNAGIYQRADQLMSEVTGSFDSSVCVESVVLSWLKF